MQSNNWRSFLLRIGDKCSEYGTSTDFKEHIETCFGIIRREIEYCKEEVIKLLLDCTEQVPHKIPLYATLVGLLNLENEDLVKEIVETTHTNLQDALDTGNCNRFRILLRFVMSMMCNRIIPPTSVVVIFDTLLSSAATTVDEEKGNPSWQARADFFVVCILSTLPWGGAELAEQIPDEIERVMLGVEAYLSIRKHSPYTAFSPFGDPILGRTSGEKDFLEDLWDRIYASSNSGWKVDSVLKPHLSFEAQLVSGKSHDFFPIRCPNQPDFASIDAGTTCERQRHDAILKYPQGLRRLNIFHSSKFEGMQPVDRFVVEEYILDVLFFFNSCRKECAWYMVSLPVPFRYEYLMAETILSQLFLLPQPPFKQVYYSLVIIDLCKALPGAFPSVIAAAVRALFEKVDYFDVECRMRFSMWLSHHLSNFQFIWPWEEWSYVLHLPKCAPQRLFVKEVLEKEVRLSYWDKIKLSIENAEGLEELLPPKGGPQFYFSVEDGGEKNEQHNLCGELCTMVKAKKGARDILLWLENSVLPLHSEETSLKVVAQTFLDIGSKSFTHLVTVLERYGQVFSKIFNDEDRQIMLLDEVSSYWKHNNQMTLIVIDRMMGYCLVSSFSILKWVFTPENVLRFHTSDHMWEILGNTIRKAQNRTCDLRNEIASLRCVLSSAQEASEKTKSSLEDAESKLTLVDGKPSLGENTSKLNYLRACAERATEKLNLLQASILSKEALLVQALSENEEFFISMFKNLSTVLMERLRHVLDLDGKIHGGTQAELMDVDTETTSSNTVDKDDAETKEKRRNKKQYSLGEDEQWCVTTLGFVKALARQNASEVWPHVKRLDEEVLMENAHHPLFRRAFYEGLQRVE